MWRVGCGTQIFLPSLINQVPVCWGGGEGVQNKLKWVSKSHDENVIVWLSLQRFHPVSVKKLPNIPSQKIGREKKIWEDFAHFDQSFCPEVCVISLSDCTFVASCENTWHQMHSEGYPQKLCSYAGCPMIERMLRGAWRLFWPMRDKRDKPSLKGR